MRKRDPNAWYIPPWVALTLPMPLVFVFAMIFLPIMAWLKVGEISEIYLVAVSLGATGTALLYFARLPLYRARKFWTVGPKQLDSAYRKIYWLAYGFIAVSVMMFVELYVRI